MRKKDCGILLAAVLAVSLSACGTSAENGKDSKPEERADERIEDEGINLGQGGEIRPEASGDDTEASVPEVRSTQEELKAVGYDYDRESLTWELVWSDEFDYEGAPDPDKWGYDVGGNGWGNNELQYYTEGDNAIVRDGCLVIEARKETVGAREYTSARLVTRGKGDWLYGRVEICAKLPSGLGTWPAAWMLPTDREYGQWPASGEIDIMEHVGYDQDVIVQSVHNQKFNGGKSKGVSYHLDGVSEEFHVYSLEWLPDKLIFSTDGMERYTYDPFKISKAPTYEQWPFDKRMHILLNLAFGGSWGGAKGTDDSYFPVEYYIDYVRVYQSPEIAELIGAKENNDADQSGFSHYVGHGHGRTDQGHHPGCRALDALYRQASDFESSRIYPGLPEYFDGAGRDMYPYLTGSASWRLMTMVTEVYSVKGYYGDLILNPQTAGPAAGRGGQDGDLAGICGSAAAHRL